MSIAAIAIETNSLAAVPLPCYTHTKPHSTHSTPVNVKCYMSIAAIATVPRVSLPYLSPVALTVSPTVHQLMYSALCLLLLLL